MQYAKALGARVAATAGTAAKLATAANWAPTLRCAIGTTGRPIRDLTGRRGLDMVLDNMGAPTWRIMFGCSHRTAGSW